MLLSTLVQLVKKESVDREIQGFRERKIGKFFRHFFTSRGKVLIEAPIAIARVCSAALFCAVKTPLGVLAAPLALCSSRKKAVKCSLWGVNDGKVAAISALGAVCIPVALISPELTSNVFHQDKLYILYLKTTGAAEQVVRGYELLNITVTVDEKMRIFIGEATEEA